jgi:hypothetical protein
MDRVIARWLPSLRLALCHSPFPDSQNEECFPVSGECFAKNESDLPSDTQGAFGMTGP